ncbi:NRT1 PTR FAMILY -like [Olea europaea subsp. europaea]|uniref:NRT1 PTR FAMILY -like n=1 Tax=Olea europaea subsp. europaea TaxID=158383 RepID=A0A8S0Q0R9_OLEEU|nr:NRT1 PTR FAMILY -like [Olea europaea subsp. europaea]
MVDSAYPLPISIFWLGIQYAIFGMADMFTLVGLLEFFHAESSSRMKSLSTAISWCSLAFGYFMSSVLVNVVNKVTHRLKHREFWFLLVMCPLVQV